MRQEITIIVVAYLLLFIIGALAMYSLDIARERVLGTSSNFFVRHLFNIFVGLIAFYVTMNIPFSFYERHIKLLYFLGILLLLIVFVFPPVNGAHRWINIRGFTLQSSEFAKIILILFLSIYAKNNYKEMEKFTKGFAIPLLYSIVYVALIVVEPNLSTALLTFIIAIVAMYYGGTKLSYFIFSFVAAVALVVIAFSIGLLHSYQMGRLRYFFSGTMAPQVDIALKTLKNSNATGLGIGNGWLKVYVPEAESDFVLSVIGEDLGFFGILIVGVMYFFLTYALMRAASYIKDVAVRVFTWSYATVIMLHVVINFGVFSGFFPVTGVPLPFISTGGSSIISLLIGFGIIMSGLTQKQGEDTGEKTNIKEYYIQR
ncbi:MAG TPA: FtsW/RodA/SpoVE family cell cycle protein [Fervidobacterium nodosum]|nr:FtsW/RodA/SpoVE family cell cycle protein [Fervidobacterium nodosum]